MDPAKRASAMSTSHFVSLPATKPPPSGGARALVYFIPGNPGFIDWYAGFLHSLRHHLDDIQADVAFDIYGRSLPGFHDEEHAPFSAENPPYSLEDIIAVSYASLAERRASTPQSLSDDDDGSSGRPYDFAVLIGHSVGAYIGLEIFARHQRDPSPAPHLRLHHGILLCPTITHIARSSCGRFFSFLCSFALLRAHLHRLLSFLLFFIPAFVLYAWCRYLMGFSAEAAAIAARFCKSPGALWQTLHMGRQEMDAIADDEWEDELWEVLRDDEQHRHRVPKFFFLFAKTDHWVSCRERDAFIAKMRRHAAREGPDHKKGRTEIEIDPGRFPHAFSTRECEFSFCPLRCCVLGPVEDVAASLSPNIGANVYNSASLWCSCCGAGVQLAWEDTGLSGHAQVDCRNLLQEGRGCDRLRVCEYPYPRIEIAYRKHLFTPLLTFTFEKENTDVFSLSPFQGWRGGFPVLPMTFLSPSDGRRPLTIHEIARRCECYSKF